MNEKHQCNQDERIIFLFELYFRESHTFSSVQSVRKDANRAYKKKYITIYLYVW